MFACDPTIFVASSVRLAKGVLTLNSTFDVRTPLVNAIGILGFHSSNEALLNDLRSCTDKLAMVCASSMAEGDAVTRL